MSKKMLLLAVILAIGSLLAACSSAATPTPAPAPTRASSASTTQPSTGNSSGAAFETKSNEAGSVTVDVKPTALLIGQPLVFDIAMNTHSVDLSVDLTKITILRDDSGKEYQPTAWEGAGPAHHREGTLKFAALTSKPKYVELVIKGLATVPERVFRWDLSS